MGSQSLRAVETHFEFGENWLDYLQHVDEAAMLEAERGLTRLVPREAIRGARFLDIGCGSGLHSLAAIRLGAAELVALDIDPNSVEATRRLLEKHAPAASAQARVQSIFEADPAELGRFDIVYSWGVLHHTGAMWDAVARAARLVRPGGLFALALYERRLSCLWWKPEKWLYTKSPEFVRRGLRGLYKGLFYAGLLATGRRPSAYLATYKSARGMNFHNDVHDWMGGYPYESATVEEVRERMRPLGFEMIHLYPIKSGIRPLGTGCAEFTLQRVRDGEAASAAR